MTGVQAEITFLPAHPPDLVLPRVTDPLMIAPCRANRVAAVIAAPQSLALAKR